MKCRALLEKDRPSVDLILFAARKEEPRALSVLILSLIQLIEHRGMEHWMLPHCPMLWCSSGKRSW